MKALSTAILATLVGLSLQQTNIYKYATGIKGHFYSSAAYCKYETLDNWDCGRPCKENSGLKEIKRIHNAARDTFAYAGWNNKDNEIVLAFRGTNGADLENWISNIKVFMKAYPDY